MLDALIIPPDVGEYGWKEQCIAIFQACSVPIPTAPVIERVVCEQAEARLHCSLPEDLKLFYETFGLLDVNESLLHPEEMIWLSDWADELGNSELSSAEADVLPHLVMISRDEDSGNAFCLDCRDDSIWLYDDATSPFLSRFFTNVSDYLKASLILMQEDALGGQDPEEKVEATLEDIYGQELVIKWLY